MSRTRVRVVFLLLILILLVVSALLGLLTWWLGQQPPSQDRGAGSELWLADDSAVSAFPAVVWVKR